MYQFFLLTSDISIIVAIPLLTLLNVPYSYVASQFLPYFYNWFLLQHVFKSMLYFSHATNSVLLMFLPCVNHQRLFSQENYSRLLF